MGRREKQEAMGPKEIKRKESVGDITYPAIEFSLTLPRIRFPGARHGRCQGRSFSSNRGP